MYSVCFVAETKPWLQDQWSFVFSNFGVQDIWQIGQEDIYQPHSIIKNADELPEKEIIVLAPKNGKYIRGENSIKDFSHPTHCTYLFGSSHLNLNQDNMGSRSYTSIYIPTVEHEMYAHCAAYITLWDRLIKSG